MIKHSSSQDKGHQSRPSSAPLPTPDLDSILVQLIRFVEVYNDDEDISEEDRESINKAKAAILATHIPKDRVRAALMDEVPLRGKDTVYRALRHAIDGRNELRASLRQQLLEEA